MNHKIIRTNDSSHSILDTKINESYHSKHGAIVEAKHVFIKNGFETANKNKLNILEIGFGTGLNTLLTLQKSIQKSIKVNYHAIELHPLDKQYYSKLNYTNLIGVEQKELLKLHDCKWGKKIKLNSFFSIIKHHMALEKYNTNLKFDIIYFDAFSPRKQPEIWSKDIFEKMHKFLKKDGFLITYCAKGAVKRTMKSVGFEIIILDGPPGKRQITRGNKSII